MYIMYKSWYLLFLPFSLCHWPWEWRSFFPWKYLTTLAAFFLRNMLGSCLKKMRHGMKYSASWWNKRQMTSFGNQSELLLQHRGETVFQTQTDTCSVLIIFHLQLLGEKKFYCSKSKFPVAGDKPPFIKRSMVSVTELIPRGTHRSPQTVRNEGIWRT